MIGAADFFPTAASAADGLEGWPGCYSKATRNPIPNTSPALHDEDIFTDAVALPDGQGGSPSELRGKIG